MSTFNFDKESISDSGAIARSISDSIYPSNQIVVKGTSDSTRGVSRNKTLTNQGLAEALSGDVLFTSLKSTNVAMNQLMDSSLNRALTGFSEAGFTTGATYSIPNPDKTNSTAKLTGGMAVSRNIVDSIAGRKLMSGFVNKAAKSISNDYSTFSSYPQGGGTPHSTTPYSLDGASLGGGSRAVLLDSVFSAAEKTWYMERANILKNTGMLYSNDANQLINGYNFDIPDDLQTLYTTKTEYPNMTDSSVLSRELIQAPLQKAYVCPALIELLIYLSSKIVIEGGFGLHRATNQNQMGPNNSPLEEGDSVTDHALGRGFDIMKVGNINQTLYNLQEGVSNPDIYRSGLEAFLTVLAAAPGHLLPDFMAISVSLQTEYGILDEGFEEETANIKVKYPTLKYINFHSDATHKNHIHISFSGARSGVYVGSGGAMSTGGIGIPYGTPDTNERLAPTSSEQFRTADSYERESQNLNTSSYYSRLAELNTTVGAGENNGYVAPPAASSSPAPAGNAFITFIRKTLLENPFQTMLPTQNPSPLPGYAIGSIALTADLNIPKYTDNYQTRISDRLTGPEVFNLLRLTVMSDEAACLFCIIGGREGGSSPAALNIDRGNDWSVGMFQTNLRNGAHGEKDFYMATSGRLEKGWKLGFKNWQSYIGEFGQTGENFNTVAYDIVDRLEADSPGSFERRTLVDSDLFIPINQAYMLHMVIKSSNFSGVKLGEVLETSFIFSPWGDYGEDKGNGYFSGQPYGWITNLRFSSAIPFYEATGGSESQLRQWVLDVYSKDPSASNFRSAEYIEDWVNGYYFPATYVPGSGWRADEPEAP